MRQYDASTWSILTRLLDEGVVIWCAAIQVNDDEAFFLARNPEAITFRSQTWEPFPFEVGIMEGGGEGDLLATTITLANVLRVPMQYLETGGWDQKSVSLFLVQAAGPVELARFDFAIQAATARDDAVTLTVGRPNYFDRPFPAARYVRAAGYPGIPRNGGR